MFTCVEKRYTFIPSEIKEARKKCKSNLRQFADVCGWSAQYIWKLENGKVNTINETAKLAIERCIDETKTNDRKTSE